MGKSYPIKVASPQCVKVLETMLVESREWPMQSDNGRNETWYSRIREHAGSDFNLQKESEHYWQVAMKDYTNSRGKPRPSSSGALLNEWIRTNGGDWREYARVAVRAWYDSAISPYRGMTYHGHGLGGIPMVQKLQEGILRDLGLLGDTDYQFAADKGSNERIGRVSRRL